MAHVYWRYPNNSWRVFSKRWFLHWLDVRVFWYDLKDAVQRSRRGWADGDIFDLVSYHAGVTLGLLKHFKANHHGYMDGMTKEEYEAKLDLAVDAWEAKYALMTDEGWDANNQTYKEWSDPLVERWENGHPAFIEIYDSLWN